MHRAACLFFAKCLFFSTLAFGSLAAPAAAEIGADGTEIAGAPSDVGRAAISGDGGWVAFETDTVPIGVSLWSVSTRQVVSVDSEGRSPDVSSDGRWVVYIKDVDGDQQVRLWDRQTATSDVLASATAFASSPSISDDGNVVVWNESRAGTTAEVWRRGVSQVLSIPFTTGTPFVSGDGRYVFGNESMTSGFRYDLQSDLRQVLSVRPAGVSDDGTKVAYNLGEFQPSSRYGVGILDIDTGVVVELETPNPEIVVLSPAARDIVISGDGSTVFFRTPSSLVVRDIDPLDRNAADTYRWSPSRASLDFTDAPGDSIIDVSDDGRAGVGLGTEFGTFSTFAHYTFPPVLTTPEPVDVDVVSAPQLVDQVSRLYSAFFLRPPDAQGLPFWVDQRARGASVVDLANAFVASPEFVDRYGELSNVEFVELIYRNLFDREPDSGGRAFWTSQLSQGAGRGSVMIAFSESPEYVERTGTNPAAPAAASQLWRLYRAYLGRNPDQGGFDYWYTQLANDVSLAAVSEGFARSTEFIDTYGQLTDRAFVELIYRDVLGRSAESGGLAFWVSQLEAGETRGAVMLAFSESPEYLVLTDSLPA